MTSNSIEHRAWYQRAISRRVVSLTLSIPTNSNRLMVRLAFACLAFAVLGGTPNRAAAQYGTESFSDDAIEYARRKFRGSHGRDNAAMKRLVAPIAGKSRKSVVQVLCGGVPVTLGTIVGVDGYVLTKHSELTNEPIRLKMSDNRLLSGMLVQTSPGNDLALIKIESADTFVPVKLVDATPAPGSFLISPGRTGRAMGLGFVGAERIRVGHQGRLGVNLSSAESLGAMVRRIQPGSGADMAGIEKGDRIIAINGKQQNDRFQVVAELGKKYPGDVVRLTIVRDGNELEMNARMRDLRVLQESENDARVNGPRNDRLSGFNDVIQHDTVLDPDECGGPLMDSDGRVIGINIARAGRVVSYALPAAVLMKDVSKMLNEARSQAIPAQVIQAPPVPATAIPKQNGLPPVAPVYVP